MAKKKPPRPLSPPRRARIARQIDLLSRRRGDVASAYQQLLDAAVAGDACELVDYTKEMRARIRATLRQLPDLRDRTTAPRLA
mgnify:FL=1